MIFAPDTEVALSYAASLINSKPTPQSPETLNTVEDLLAHMAAFRWTGVMPTSEADLAQVRRTRDRLRELWNSAQQGDLESLVSAVNALLRSGRALPQLVIHEPYGWHIHATEPDAPVAVRMSVEAAMAMVDVIRTDSLDRLLVCAGEDCDNVLIDLSRNRSRKFCDPLCAGRTHSAAYRARKADG